MVHGAGGRSRGTVSDSHRFGGRPWSRRSAHPEQWQGSQPTTHDDHAFEHGARWRRLPAVFRRLRTREDASGHRRTLVRLRSRNEARPREQPIDLRSSLRRPGAARTRHRCRRWGDLVGSSLAAPLTATRPRRGGLGRSAVGCSTEAPSPAPGRAEPAPQGRRPRTLPWYGVQASDDPIHGQGGAPRSAVLASR